MNNSNSEFNPLPNDEALWLSDNPEEAIISIDIKILNLNKSWLGDDGSVICSQHEAGCCWIFSTLKAPAFPATSDGYHPVSGNRQFGYEIDSEGRMVIYTKGADRFFYPLLGPTQTIPQPSPSNVLVYVLEKIAFQGADALWQSMLEGVFNFVEQPDLGGSAEVQTPVINRPAFTGEVYQLLLQDHPINSVPCCCD